MEMENWGFRSEGSGLGGGISLRIRVLPQQTRLMERAARRLHIRKAVHIRKVPPLPIRQVLPFRIRKVLPSVDGAVRRAA